jgi:hypothetical protein
MPPTFLSPLGPAASYGASSTYFLQSDMNQLLKIAHGPRSPERDWLAFNLPGFPVSPERQRLMQALTHGSRHSVH